MMRGPVETVLSRRLDDLEPHLTRHGYDLRSLCEQFDARPAEIRQLLRGDLDPALYPIRGPQTVIALARPIARELERVAAAASCSAAATCSGAQ